VFVCVRVCVLTYIAIHVYIYIYSVVVVRNPAPGFLLGKKNVLLPEGETVIFPAAELASLAERVTLAFLALRDSLESRVEASMQTRDLEGYAFFCFTESHAWTGTHRPSKRFNFIRVKSFV
jgi:hypothetical protein